MLPSDYISRFSRYRDYLALQQILDDYKEQNTELTCSVAINVSKDIRDKQMLKKFNEYVNQVAFAEDKIREWKKLENAAV